MQVKILIYQISMMLTFLYRKIENKVVIQMTIIRSGCNYGSKSYFPSPGKNGTDVLEEEIMQAFICQFYDKNIPQKIFLLI